MQLTTAALESMYYGFSRMFEAAFTATAPWVDAIATTTTSTTRENRYPWMASIPKLREWIGERILHNLALRSYAIVNKDWEDTVEVDRNDVEDDNLGVYAPIMATLGQQARLWPQDMVLATLKAGETAVGFDGQPFFNANHPLNVDNTGGGVYSNLFTGTALTADNYNTVRAAMRVINDEQGRTLGVNPDILLVPPQLERMAKSIVDAEMYAVGGVVVNNVMRGTARVIVASELADEPGNWYLLDSTKPIKPIIAQIRKQPQLVALTDPTTENVFFRKKFIYGVDSRGNAGFSLPFLAAKAKA